VIEDKELAQLGLAKDVARSLVMKPMGRAKNLSIRIDAATRQAVIILPPRMSRAAALRFAKKHEGWISGQLAALPPRVSFVPGAVVPFLGDPHLLVHQADQPRLPTKREGQTIVTGGDVDAFAGRIDRFLRAEARSAIRPLVDDYAAKLGKQPGRLSIKDTKSRWGSCTPGRDLSFSWRLILAPPQVLRYVVAHEAAHMVELNHSARFWGQVEKLMPGHNSARQWLTDNGMALHAYGR